MHYNIRATRGLVCNKYIKLITKYFYKYLSDLDEDQRQIICAMRTKTGLVILCDRLKAIEVENQVIQRIYEQLKLFLR